MDGQGRVLGPQDQADGPHGRHLCGAVELLKAFINVDTMSNTQLAWRAGIHLVFVISGVLFVVTDHIAEGKGESH